MRGRETLMRERNIINWLPLAHPQLGTWPATQACALTGNRTGNLTVHRLVLNPLSHISQGEISKILKKRKRWREHEESKHAWPRGISIWGCWQLLYVTNESKKDYPHSAIFGEIKLQFYQTGFSFETRP